MLTGRDFDELDRPSSLPVAIVNEQLAKRAWPGENAIGKQLRVLHDGEPQVWRTIVGVVGNIIQNDVTRQTFEPVVYVPYAQDPSRNMFVFVRARDDPQRLTPDVSREVYSLDADLPVPTLMPLAHRLAGASAFSRNVAAVFFAFAAVALLLSCVGLYAAVARTVISRTHEIGVRIAMGASRRDISRLVLRIAQWPLLIGLGLGLAGAFAVGRVLRAGLVGVAPTDPLTFALAAVVLVVAAAVGCAIPARRAMRVDPVQALRED
jgi:ABC-type antimicrobial peptide transport system permease subunit